MRQRIKKWVKQEIVCCIAFLLAIVSSFMVKPNRAYIAYIDWRVLAILFSLMAVMAGLQKHGIFEQIGIYLLKKTNNTRQLEASLIFLCFFSSMFITNDVALITFVPFAILTLKLAKQEKRLVKVLVFQTAAANLGSMLTPIGNPQNLYLYGITKMKLITFFAMAAPFVIVTFFALLFILYLTPKEPITLELNQMIGNKNISGDDKHNQRGAGILYSMLFLFCLTAVVRIIPYYIVWLVVFLAIFFWDKQVLQRVDYMLLLTFIGFFIFVGNMGNVVWVKKMLEQLVTGKEVIVAILASQCISNVPAALLLARFTNNFQALLVGVNLGGLGTLIASMASLISYKYYVNQAAEDKIKYVLYFTIVNIAFLLLLLVVWFVFMRFSSWYT